MELERRNFRKQLEVITTGNDLFGVYSRCLFSKRIKRTVPYSRHVDITMWLLFEIIFWSGNKFQIRWQRIPAAKSERYLT
jgi:hypothetical protein